MLFAKDIGIDLGTANCLVHLKGKVLFFVSLCGGHSKRYWSSIGSGEEAKKMIGRTPGNRWLFLKGG